LYENVKDVIRENDIAVINQETPFVDDPALYGDYPKFGTPVQVGEAIANAGFDVVTCATNHALDRGTEGINVTKAFFTANRIKCLGIQSEEDTEYHPYEILVRNGVRFALLNYTYGTNGIRLPEENPNMVHLLDDENKIINDIEMAKAESDFVIVFVHWGTEYAGEPDDFQRKWAQLFAECGVDVVVGTHPHTIQPYEVIQGKNGHEMLVYYSIGNYISAQPEESCVKGGMASFTVSLTPEGYKVTEYGFWPLTIRWQEGGKYVTEF
ncbi:MAG: CapA family protein, partial [Lachnospiraceae bacterium]|nr:CapA family protein [Lachnospiraceae bacterium]